MLSLVTLAAGPGFEAPDSGDFQFPDIAGGITKPMVLVVLSVVIVFGFFMLTGRRALVVPNRAQFAGESVYRFVRDGVAQDAIGPEFARFVPYLTALFSFVLVNNIFGIIPIIQFPSMSRIGFPAVLAIVSWLVFNYVGVKRKGLRAYLKQVVYPPGVPTWILPLIIPLEFIQTILTRPLTLGLRLFANMFAGHLMLLVFILGGEFMLLHGSGALPFLSPFAFLMGIAMTIFEALIQVLQAYIFVLLTALYIAGALADEH
ncbi:MAG: F-type H+-transporting ATPase subunit a [Mycobacteriales bacterium]